MSLYQQLQQRAAAGRPIRVGLIGAGKFGSMYLAQVPRTPGVHLAAIADLSPANARANGSTLRIAQHSSGSVSQRSSGGTSGSITVRFRSYRSRMRSTYQCVSAK